MVCDLRRHAGRHDFVKYQRAKLGESWTPGRDRTCGDRDVVRVGVSIVSLTFGHPVVTGHMVIDVGSVWESVSEP